MMTVMLLGRTLVITLALSLSLANSVGAGETKKAGKGAKLAKSSNQAPPEVRMTLEPKALEVLKACCNRLAAARTMSFTALVTEENPSLLGTPLAYTTKSDVVLQRPNKLLVLTPGDGPATEFYYDGKMMMAYAPAENLVALADAPPTIDAALKTAYTTAAIYFPFTDLIVADPYKDISDGLAVAFYMGQSQVVGGTTTDMIAYANNDVFVQAWIGAEDKLPRLLRAVYLADNAALRHQMELSNWQLESAVRPESFTSAKAKSANPIPFAHPNAPRPSAVRPSPMSVPPKAKDDSQ